MIKIEKTEVVGWEHAIRGMRNPMNSWEKSDSGYTCGDHCCNLMPGCNLCCDIPHYVVRKNDHELMMKLANGGPVHAKYRRMITVYLDITAPLYWWKEFDTYKVGTVANSCSTMHKIHEKEFTLADFSCEHLTLDAKMLLLNTIKYLNSYRDVYQNGFKAVPGDDNGMPDIKPKDKKYWWQMIQLLPSSYNQKRTVMLNYEVLNNIYHSRKEHKLDEWREFCKWIESLPYSEIITGEVGGEEE